eukprot:gene23120-29313_t
MRESRNDSAHFNELNYNNIGKVVENVAKAMKNGAVLEIEWDPGVTLNANEKPNSNPFHGVYVLGVALSSLLWPHLEHNPRGGADKIKHKVDAKLVAQIRSHLRFYHEVLGVGSSVSELAERLYWEANTAMGLIQKKTEKVHLSCNLRSDRQEVVLEALQSRHYGQFPEASHCLEVVTYRDEEGEEITGHVYDLGSLMTNSVLDGENAKVWYRSALALEAMNEHLASFTCLKRISDTSDKDSGTVMRRLISRYGANNLKKLSFVELSKVLLRRLIPESFDASIQSHFTKTLSSDVMVLKAVADESYRRAQYSDAIQQYTDCMAAFTGPDTDFNPVILLSNTAQCRLTDGDGAHAALNALVAVTFDSSHAKSRCRLAEALLKLELYEQAKSVCDRAIAQGQDGKMFASLMSRIKTAVIAAKNKPKMPGTSEGSVSHATEKELRDKQVREATSYENMKQTNATNSLPSTQAVLTGTGMTSLVETRVVDFHTEFMNAGRLTAGCDRERCRSFLSYAYESAKGIPMHEYRYVNNSLAKADRMPNEQAFRERFGGNITEKLKEFSCTAQMGDVFFEDSLASYDHSLLQSMSNATTRAQFFSWGDTHVAVGFVDLGSLFHAMFDNYPDSGALKWVGYEASAYCVAKTRVVAEMMRIGADVTSVLQVSYSSGWSRKTDTQFREALASLLTPVAITACENEVSAYFRHWQTHQVPLSSAISKWFDTRADAGTVISNFKRKIDRVDFTHYYLTGQLLDCEVGSVVMFANPYERESLATNSSFFHSVPDRESMFGDKNVSFVTAAVNAVKIKIGRIAEHVRAGRIVMSVRFGSVSLEQPARVREISALKPWTMSWSNVCDYFHPKEFHQLARRCSDVEDTVHYAYTMNWTMNVLGSQIFEYQMMVAVSEDKSTKKLQDIIASGKMGVSVLYNTMGVSQYMICPPIYNVRNMTAYTLGMTCYEDYVKAFFDFSVDKKAGCERANVGMVEFGMLNLLNRSCTQINFTFTYDKEIKFGGEYI